MQPTVLPAATKWRNASSAQRRVPPGTMTSTATATVPPTTCNWDMQLSRGKVNTRCFWNACKALSFGLLLMLIGGTMAIIGYYADQLSVTQQELRKNTTTTSTPTVRHKSESKDFHLNNLSYAGPIVMGVGGFIVVAACVMTFEARDSASKVVPARLKYAAAHGHRLYKPSPAVSSKLHSSMRSDSRRSTSCQTKWEQQQGLYRTGGPGSPCASEILNRRALTAAFIQFSKNLQQAGIDRSYQTSPISKSPSAPNLAENQRPPLPSSLSPFMKPQISPRQRQKRSRNSLHPIGSGCTLLNPHALLQRQALSMDNPDYNPYFSPPRSQHISREHSGKGSGESRESLEIDVGAACQAHGSQTSMAMDLHLPNDCPVTLRVRDKTKRSDTAKRHVFVRQQQVDDEDAASDRSRETHSCSPRLPGYYPRCYDDIRPYSRSTPHSRRESISSKMPTRSNTEEHPRSRSNTNESLPAHVNIAATHRRYSRKNSADDRRRRGSNTSESRHKETPSTLSRSNTYERQPYQLEAQLSTCSGRSSDMMETATTMSSLETAVLTDEKFIVVEEVVVVNQEAPTTSSNSGGCTTPSEKT